MKKETEKSKYRVCGAPSDNTPGYVLGYYETRKSAERAIAQFRGRHTCVWLESKQSNGDYANWQN